MDHQAFESVTRGTIRRLDGLNRDGFDRGCLRVLPNLASPQEVDTAIVGYPEQPRLQSAAVVATFVPPLK
jgi:hypothetical protein